MSRKNKLLVAAFVLGCIVVVAVAGIARVAATGNFGNDKLICNGVKIGDVDVGGLTKEEASGIIDDYIKGLHERSVTIQVADHRVETTFQELGFTAGANDYVDQAFNIGKKGNILQRLRELNKVEKNGKTYELEYNLSQDAIREFVKKECSKYDVKAKNSKLKLKNGKFRATKECDGHEVQVDKTVEVIEQALTNYDSEEPVSVDAVIETTKPKYTKEMVSKCQDLLGSYATTYATSTAARATNVKTAAEYIDGTVVYPGKTFSTIKVIRDRTEENGYQSAAEYSSGKVVEGIGGGVCQVSTTLYNAVINAELEVVERSPHSMVVGYVDVSRDAAISGDYKDFKFKNNTDVPIYIAATADGSTLSFRIYGQETRAENRTIEFESEIIETIQPGKDVETVDETKPESYRAVTQSAHVGYKAKLWKLVYIDGVQTEKVEVNYSAYSAEPQYVTVGKKAKATPTPKPKSKKDKDAEASAEPEESASAKPKNSTSAKPKATKSAARETVTPKPNATAKSSAGENGE